MARIYPLFSSSKGNSTFIGDRESGILIDCGVSFKRLTLALEANDISLSAINGVFLTHSHSDHIKGIKMLYKKLSCPIYSQKDTLIDCLAEEWDDDRIRIIEGKINCGNLVVSCFNTPHDTSSSCGYKVEFPDGRKCAVCTDLGYVTPTVEKALLGCDLVLLEANYDEKMLKKGEYPGWLKERIASKHGHLSNNASGEFAKKLIANGTTRIVLGHLSQENNTPEIAEKTVLSYLTEYKRNNDYILSVAPVETSGEMVVF